MKLFAYQAGQFGPAVCVTITIALAGILNGGCSREKALDAPYVSRAIADELRELSAKPLRLSPDGQSILFSISGDGRPFGLEVRPMSGPTPLAKVYSDQPIIRATWRPDSRAIAYFQQDDKAERHLVFWDLLNNTHRSVETPVTHNEYEVKWSPDGSMLAFTSDEKEIIIVDSSHVVLRFPGWFRTFSWNSSSTKIGLVKDSHEVADEIVWLDVVSGKSSSLRVAPPWNLINLEWSPFAEALLLGRTPDKTHCVLIASSDKDSEARLLCEIPANSSEPHWCPGHDQLMWLAQPKNEWRRIALAYPNGSLIREVKLEANISFMQFTPDGKGIFAQVTSPKVFDIVRFDFSVAKASETVAQVQGLPPTESTYETVKIPGEGGDIRIDVSKRTMRSERKGVTVIRMLGGGAPEFVANWPERQLYLRHGVDYISVPNRPNYGADDLLRVCEYVELNLGVSRAKIVVYGTSTAASIALTAAMRSPDAFGMLVLVGLISDPDHVPIDGLGDMRVLAFHGARDPIPPVRGRQILSQFVGRETFMAPKGLWYTFSGEAHSFNLADSAVHATILKETKVIE